MVSIAMTGLGSEKGDRKAHAQTQVRQTIMSSGQRRTLTIYVLTLRPGPRSGRGRNKREKGELREHRHPAPGALGEAEHYAVKGTIRDQHYVQKY